MSEFFRFAQVRKENPSVSASRVLGPRAEKKPGFPRLSGQWSPPAYGDAGLKMCVLAQFPGRAAIW